MKPESDGCGGREKPAYDTISSANLEKLKKLKSPKVTAGHYKEFNKELSFEEIQKTAENWNPSNFKTFNSHDPSDYEGKDKVVDISKSGKI